jgi:chemotaxis protein CheD
MHEEHRKKIMNWAAEGSDRRSSQGQENYFNSQFTAKPLYLDPGQSIWSDREDEMIIATIGSGVVVLVYDKDLNMGAAGYTFLPGVLLDEFPYFDRADPVLLEETIQPVVDCIGHMKRRGAAKTRLHVRLVGGTSLPEDLKDSGTKNYVFVREYITRKGMTVLNADLGGSLIRRLHFFPATGRAVRRLLRRESDFAAMKLLEKEFRE